MMELRIWFLFSTCFVLYPSTPVIDSGEEDRKLTELLNYVDPVKHTAYLKKVIVNERKEMDAKLENERKEMDAKLEREKKEMHAQLMNERKEMHAKLMEAANRTLQEQRRADKIEYDKVDSDKYQLLLGTRRRVNTLEMLLCTRVLTGDRIQRWKTIFEQENNTNVEHFRMRIKADGLNEEQFGQIVSLLCQDTNAHAVHANVPIPQDVDDRTIVGALNLMEIPSDLRIMKAYRLIIEPLQEFKDPAAKNDG